uniref:Uncharacterized protein n=1 Tax=Florenciella parvula TaxID=236787 RepID=A0A7S2BA90_9STRA
MAALNSLRSLSGVARPLKSGIRTFVSTPPLNLSSRERFASEMRSQRGIFGYRATPTPVIAETVEKGEAANLHTTILSLRRIKDSAHSESAKRYEQIAEAVGMRRRGRNERFPWRPS